MSPKNVSLPLSLLCLTGVLAAQQTILPSAVATTRPTSSTFYSSFLFYGSSSLPPDSHTQLIYATSDIAAPVATWNSLSVRRPVGLGNSNSALNGTATIMMSVSPLAFGSTTTTFATNHGAAPTTVLNGPISLPAAANQAAWPAPWQVIPFTVPFSYVAAAGQSLVVDVQQSSPGLTSPWYTEAWYPDTGARTSNPSAQSTCRFSTGSYNNSISYRFPVVGGTWFVTYSNVLPNTFGFCALGSQGVGGTWNGIPLPFDLGLLGATGCSWNVSADVMLPISSDANGRATWPTLSIPPDPWFRNAEFYDHAGLVDLAANSLGLVTTWSSKWRIGTNQGQPGCVVYATGNNALNPTGTRANETTVSIELN